MATTTPLTDAINALTTYANETTGASDTTLSDAVATLVSGYGSGSSSSTDFFDMSYPSGALSTTSTTITEGACYNRTGITSISAPNVTTIKPKICYGCTGLQTVSFPSVTQLNNACFQNCTSLTAFETESTVNYNNQAYLFNGCTSLATVNTPYATGNIGQEAFAGCTSLTYCDLGNVGAISTYRAFRNCTALSTLILRKSSVVSLNNNAFYASSIESGGNGCTVYVPSDLISSYQSASNWSTYYGYGTITFTAIEGSDYEL